MEDTFKRSKREKEYTVKVGKKQKGNGGHSKHHAQTDAGKEKGNGGHFLEKQKGKAGQSQGGKETQREWRTLSRETKGDWATHCVLWCSHGVCHVMELGVGLESHGGERL